MDHYRKMYEPAGRNYQSLKTFLRGKGRLSWVLLPGAERHSISGRELEVEISKWVAELNDHDTFQKLVAIHLVSLHLKNRVRETIYERHRLPRKHPQHMRCYRPRNQKQRKKRVLTFPTIREKKGGVYKSLNRNVKNTSLTSQRQSMFRKDNVTLSAVPGIALIFIYCNCLINKLQIYIKYVIIGLSLVGEFY